MAPLLNSSVAFSSKLRMRTIVSKSRSISSTPILRFDPLRASATRAVAVMTIASEAGFQRPNDVVIVVDCVEHVHLSHAVNGGERPQAATSPIAISAPVGQDGADR